MPRERFYNLAPEARARLLGTATHHFAKRGLQRASLNEILIEAGISKGAYYYYFDDKDDLFATALESAFDELYSQLNVPDFEGLSHDEFWPTVERFVAESASAFDMSSDLVQAALLLTDTQRKSARFAPILAKAQSVYRSLIEPGQRLGCIRKDLPVEALVRLLEANDAVLDSIFMASHRTMTKRALDRHVWLVFDTFKRLLATDPATLAPQRRHAR
jgi:AcrR family transcriptional regulator